MNLKFENEYFKKDSIFFQIDERTTRGTLPTGHFETNFRANWFFNDNKRMIEGKKILDLGCFNGLYSYCCLNMGAEYVYGIDITQKQIDNANTVFTNFPEHSGKYRFEAGEILSKLKDIPDNSYDTTLLIGVLYFIPDAFELMREINRVTKQFVLVDTFSTAYLPLLYHKLYSYREYVHLLNGAFCYWRDREGDDFSNRGFEVKKFGGKTSMTYHSQNHLKMLLNTNGFSKTKFLQFDDNLEGIYKNYTSDENFNVVDTSKLEKVFEMIREDYNKGIYPYFLNTRYTVVGEK